MFQGQMGLELDEMWSISIFCTEISEPEVSSLENRYNTLDIYIEYVQNNLVFLLFTGIYMQ